MQAHPGVVYHERSQCLTLERNPLPKLAGTVGIVGAGTADLPVVEEAAVTLALMGITAKIVNDAGVAGRGSSKWDGTANPSVGCEMSVGRTEVGVAIRSSWLCF